MTKIITHFEYPPIPIRQFDWYAIDDDTYDGEGCPIGRGATEEDAINDLLDKICAARGAYCDAPDCAYCGAAIGGACQAKIVRVGARKDGRR